MIKSISAYDFYKLSNINIIDIRDIDKYNDSHIIGAINIPFDKLLINFNILLNKDSKYYIYCENGIESIKMCQILSNYGYNVINIDGGYKSLIKK